jgi:hypothetical protein
MWKSIKNLLSSGSSRSGSRKSRLSADSFVSASGRVKPQEIRDFARSVSTAEFIGTVHFPVLVGSLIHSGYLMPNPSAAPPPEGRKKTHLFKADTIAKFVEGASLEHSIFPVKHGPSSKNPDDTFIYIGRGDDNDVIMNDFSVSQRHALITITRHGYSITDLGSTNGTSLNGSPVFKASRPLKDGDTLTFGRYNFTFHTPPGFYTFLTKRKTSEDD